MKKFKPLKMSHLITLRGDRVSTTELPQRDFLGNKFETMIFGGEFHQAQLRWADYLSAIHGHVHVVKALNVRRFHKGCEICLQLVAQRVTDYKPPVAEEPAIRAIDLS